MPLALSDATRQLVRERAGYLCEYCQTGEFLCGLRCEIDHIIPSSRGGSDDLNNLCAACTVCNGHKYIKVEGLDSETSRMVSLFNPREQSWYDHFRWNDDGIVILGITPCGRATIDALQLNEPLRLEARTIWVYAGRHPPNV